MTGGGASPKTSFRSARGDPDGEAAALSDPLHKPAHIGRVSRNARLVFNLSLSYLATAISTLLGVSTARNDE